MAVIAKQRYKLDIAPKGGWVIVYASQHDNAAREIEFEITNQGKVFDIPANINVSVQGVKSNGGYFTHNCTYSGNVVTMALADDMTDVIGKAICVLKFTNSSQQKLATAKFILNIDSDSSSEGIVIDTEAEEIFDQLMDEIRAQATAININIATLQSMVGTPLIATTAAGMTDHNKIYVYTGSESGYTNGNWYYWNGSAWTSGGVYNSTAVNIDSIPTAGSTNTVSSGGVYTALHNTDTTLTQAGQAADAKVVGDRFSDIDSSINQYKNLSWEHGGINLNTGETTADGSTSRSRVVEYIDTTKVVKVINESTATLWMCFYSFANGTYTFVSAVNVDAGLTWNASVNHARYMRLDFRSSLTEAEKISVVVSSVQNDLLDIDISHVISRTEDIDGIMSLSPNDFFKGNISVADGVPHYGNNNYRVATRQGVTFSLNKSDKIYLRDYTDARFFVRWEKDGSWYAGNNNSWITSGEYNVTENGNYIFILSNVTEKEQNNVTDLLKLLIIKRNNLTTYVSELTERIKSGLKPLNNSANGYLEQAKPLALLHFSDIHGDVTETERINDVYQPVVNLCDDVICTGDIVPARFSDNASFITNKGFLLCIGNHDALSDQTGWDWSQMATQEQLYNKFFAPDIANWGVTYTQGITYYYKDYADAKIRLIVLNNLLNTEDMEVQKTWLTNILNDAITQQLSVIIAMHYHPVNAQKINSNFTNIDADVGNSTTAGGAIPYRVSQFVNNGGKFICYLVGHEHRDFVLNSSGYPEQLAICIDAASVPQSNIYSELDRRYGDKSQDLYNVSIFDTSTKTIKIIRVGCDLDNYMRPRKTIVINYETGNIISQN